MSTIFKCAKRNDVANLKKLMASGYTLGQKTFDDETILHVACLRGSEDVVTFLFTQNIDFVNSKTRNFQETALHMAVQEGHTNIVRLLFDNNCDLNAENCEGETPIFVAVRWGREDIIPLLVSKGADPNHLNANKESPLAVAITFKNPKIIDALLKSKADSRLPCIDQQQFEACKRLSSVYMDTPGDLPSPRHVTPPGTLRNVERSLVSDEFSRFARNIDNAEIQDAFQILFQGDPAALQALIFKGFNVDTKICDDETMLHTAAQLKKAEFVRILIDAKCDINAKTSQFQETTLHIAISEDADDVAQLLIESNADLEAANIEGETPIFAAVKSGNAKLVDLLIAHNANVRHENLSGVTPYQLALMLHEESISRKLADAKTQIRVSDPVRPKSTSAIPIVQTVDKPRVHPPIADPSPLYNELFAAIHRKDRTSVKLLLDKGLDVNIVDGKFGIPLHSAIEFCDLDVVKLFIAAGADADFGDSEYPLHVAMRCQKRDIARYLLEQCRNPNVCNKENETPIYSAIRARDVTLVQALVERGCNMNTVNGNNMSPLYVAVGLRQLPIVKYMLNNGADPNNTGLACLKLAQDLHDNQMINILMSAGAKTQIRRANKSRMHQSALARTIVVPVVKMRVRGENGVCSVCKGRSNLYKLIPCNHAVVCKKCINSFVDKNSQCPICNMGFYATAPV